MTTPREIEDRLRRAELALLAAEAGLDAAMLAMQSAEAEIEWLQVQLARFKEAQGNRKETIQ